MVTRCSLLILLALTAGLGTASGCRTPSQRLQATDDSALTDQSTAGLVPRAERPSGSGMLLRTGAIQLGPDVGRNLWRWQWDGEGGF
jgi:hypothetical protein